MTAKPATAPPDLSNEQRHRIEAIALSYQRLTGHPLVEIRGDLVSSLWSAPLAIVAHGTGADPVFFFGNRTALALFDMDFAAFTKLPSRLSAEPLLRDERARLLERVTRDGIIDDYAGVRISATGKRFRIENAVVWNLSGDAGTALGQAAAFWKWTPLG